MQQEQWGNRTLVSADFYVEMIFSFLIVHLKDLHTPSCFKFVTLSVKIWDGKYFHNNCWNLSG